MNYVKERENEKIRNYKTGNVVVGRRQEKALNTFFKSGILDR